MHSFINAIGTSVPNHKINQEDVSAWMCNALNISGREEKIVHSLYESTGIETRYSVIKDFSETHANFEFFPDSPDLEPFPTTKKRMEIYKEHALPLAVQAMKNCLEKSSKTRPSDITHLIVASCTGMYAPGIDIDIIEELGLKRETERTCIQFMGCYAAFNALKTADYISRANPDAIVAIVCVELCTIHFQKEKGRDTMVSNALFSDGAAAVLVSGKPGPGINLKMDSFRCMLAPDSKKEMAWQIGDSGFEMVLSSYVPNVIKSGIKDLTNQLLQNLNLSLGQVDYFAIHPGGRRILEVCEEELGLSKEDNCHAYKTLREYGNMSSPTVLFVINSIMQKLISTDTGKKILSFAFGPGLTMESMLLEVEAC
jgi:alpha-pyrone synthase